MCTGGISLSTNKWVRKDWTCDFTRARPIKAERTEQRLEVLTCFSEPEVPEQILRTERSVGLFELSNIQALFSLDSYSGKYEARL